jgi:hypothetical protein
VLTGGEEKSLKIVQKKKNKVIKKSREEIFFSSANYFIRRWIIKTHT